MVTTARRIAAHQDSPPVLPKPVAIDAVAIVDFAARTVFVQRPAHLTGQRKVAWEMGYAALSQEAYNSRQPTLWAATQTAEKVARGVAGEGQQLKFFFPVGGGSTAFSELVAKPGLAAIVTVDIEQGWFLRCLFLHRA